VSYIGLDHIDIEILKLLLNDSRISISEIAGRVGISRPTVRRRVRKLVNTGIIKRFTVDVDENMLKGVRFLFRFKVDDPDKLVKNF